MIKKVKRFIVARGLCPLIMAIILSSMFLGHLGFLSRFYQPALMVCLMIYCSKLDRAKVGRAEVLLIMACGLSIVLGAPLPIFNSWMRLGLFCIVLLLTTPLISSPAIEAFRVKLFNWVSLICAVTGVGSFFGYFLGINCMRSYYGATGVHLGGSFGGLTVQSMLLGPLASLGMLRCTMDIVQNYAQGKRSPYYLYIAAVGCFLAVLMSSSRGAAGAVIIATCYLFFVKLRHKMGKIVKLIMCIMLLGIPLSPVVEHFSSGLLAKQEANIESGGTFNSRENLWNARLDEFLDSPIYGVGFSAQRIITAEVTLLTGQVEPGTSYGAVFAMTGVLGGGIFLYILFSSLAVSKKGYLTLPQVYLVFFSIHMFVEGYVFAAGSPLCFLFWLCIGAASAIKRKPHLQNCII